MTVGSVPPSVGADFSLKPSDGSPATTPSQPSKRARASSGEGFFGEGEMDFAIVTARAMYSDFEEEGNSKEVLPGAKGMETEQGGAKVSYKDFLLGNGPSEEIPEGDELMSDESDGEDVEDDPDCLTIWIKKSIDARVRNRWKRAITFCVLGRSFPFAFIHRRTQKMWARIGGVKIGGHWKQFLSSDL
ncbi:unnamed protein product [Linum trigynum]|uniref:Uncharacterized protein n=1 Tax=Linum trigynum TaxID=586398 RepID=A0AAV2DDH3_9ROSI